MRVALWLSVDGTNGRSSRGDAGARRPALLMAVHCLCVRDAPRRTVQQSVARGQIGLSLRFAKGRGDRSLRCRHEAAPAPQRARADMAMPGRRVAAHLHMLCGCAFVYMFDARARVCARMCVMGVHLGRCHASNFFIYVTWPMCVQKCVHVSSNACICVHVWCGCARIVHTRTNAHGTHASQTCALCVRLRILCVHVRGM